MASANDQVKALKARISANKGHMRREIGAMQRAVNFLDSDPTSMTKKEVQDTFEKVKSRKDLVTELYEEIMEIDPDKINDYNARLDDLENEYNTAMAIAVEAMRKYERIKTASANSAPPRGANNTNDPMRVQTALQPDKLSRDNTPTELQSWIRKFRSFYSLSKLDKTEVVDQQAFVLQYVDIELETYLRQRIDDNTPVFGAGSCMEIIEEKFKKTYPLFTRRLDWFRYNQKSGQSGADFYAQLRMKGDVAEMADLDLDAQYVFKIICGVNDDKLREKFFKLQDPTLEEILNVMEAHDITKKSISYLDKTKQTKTTVAEANFIKMEDVKGRCFGCGNKRHQNRDSCPAKGLTCSKCNRRNHMSNMCFGPNWRPKPRSRSSSPRPYRPPTPGPRSSCVKVALSQAEFNRSTPLVEIKVRPNEGNEKLVTVTALPDSGASSSLIAESMIISNNWQEFVWQTQNTRIKVANQASMKCLGMIDLQVCIGEKVIQVTALIAKIEENIMLSWHAMQELDMLHENFPYPINKEECHAHAVQSMESRDMDKKFDKVKANFNDVLVDNLGQSAGSMKGPPVKIQLNDDKNKIRPLKTLTARQVPVHLKPKADQLIDELLHAGVIVRESNPTEWVSPAHFVPKPGNSGKVRLVTDYRVLNKIISRPVHPFPSAIDLMRQIDPESRWFAKVDAVHGYYQVKLDEESSKLTTFLLPSGKYRYVSAPMGLAPSGDFFCFKTDMAFQGLPWMLKMVDDGLIQAPTPEILLERLKVVLERCRMHGIKLSTSKLQWGQQIKFAGFTISSEGVKPDPSKVSAIREFPDPKNTTDLRSFLGLANQLGHFIPNLAQKTCKMRGLLKKGLAFTWSSDHKHEMDEVKQLLCSDLIVRPFDPTLATILLTDASRLNGIGFALMQEDDKGVKRLIECNSMSLNNAQKNYATIELEALAIRWAIIKCQYYLRGIKHFTVLTDHRPLVGIFEKPLQEIQNSRITSYRESLVDYNFNVIWTPGKTHLIADALSRSPILQPESQNAQNEVSINLCQLIETLSLEALQQDAVNDQLYQQLITAWENGKDPKSDSKLSAYRGVWDNLSIINGLLVLDGHRIVVPPESYNKILLRLHAAHQGITKTKLKARQAFYWPTMNNDITLMVEACRQCQKHLPSLPRSNDIEDKGNYPMEKVDIDLLDFRGQQWLVMVDRFSGWPFACKTQSTTTEKITTILDEWFLTWGYPRRIKSDNGPQFRDQFKQYCSLRDIECVTSSPYNHESNGCAEAAVKNVKRLLEKCSDEGSNFKLALMEFRNSPRNSSNKSPAQEFLGRRLKSILPTLPEQQISDTDSKLEADSNNNLHIGDTVLIQDPISKKWTYTGEIVESAGFADRSFLIRTEQGSHIRRNIRFLKRIKNAHSSQIPERRNGEMNEGEDICNDQQPRRSERIAKRKKVSFREDICNDQQPRRSERIAKRKKVSFRI